MERRHFFKVAAMGGGSLMVSGLTPVNGLTNLSDSTEDKKPDEATAQRTALLKGVCDIHIHASPDSKPRLINELGFARDAYKAGYRSILYKSNDFSCHDRVYLIRQELPDFEVFGSLVMNRVHGDKVNVRAAEKAVETTGKFCRCIWMPTGDAIYQLKHMNSKEQGIPVLGSDGKVLPEVVRVMEICEEAGISFATGHSSPDEAIVLARKAREVGLKRFIVTHANSGIWTMTPDQIKQSMDVGAFVEYCYLPKLWGAGTGLPEYTRMTDEEFLSFVRINPQRSFITSDLGQVGMPHPIDGMNDCIRTLQKGGISQQDIDLLLRRNPAMLVGLQG
ncbi:DUF6282 family protein [uncultured Sphingobacterium sp.]|uniref:DUF6282 family protein n=1 Tax=uncultured Sphingobacterium sp. TaxID=182688 RepID=UPI00374A207B